MSPGEPRCSGAISYARGRDNSACRRRTLHRVFGHPMLEGLIEARGTRFFQQIPAPLSLYFYEDNSRLRGLQ